MDGTPGLVGARFVSVRAQPVPDVRGAWALQITPTYVLVNDLLYDVQVRQQGCAFVQSAAPGQALELLWPDGRLPLKLQVRRQEPGWSWSGGLALDEPGEASTQHAASASQQASASTAGGGACRGGPQSVQQ